MEIYLLRHGIAEDGRPGLKDADRALTPDGREKLRLVRLVLAGTPEPVRRDLPKEAHGVAAGAAPGLRIEDLEERAQVLPPRPSEVVREGEER